MIPLRIISNRSQGERELLKLIQVEFLKLRRRKFIWLMLLAALFMPLAAVFYFSSVKGTGVDPIMFYKWTAFSYTPWIILPVVLGMLCTMLMYNENQYDMLKQLWIVPVNKMAYFFSKFAVVLVYSICFMLVTATASILTGILSGYIPFDSESVLYLLRKCMEISLLTAFAVLPVLAVAAAQKGYILPVCLTLIYTFLGFILLMVNMYLHPLSSMTAIVMYDIPGVVFDQPLNIPAAFLCIGVWAAASFGESEVQKMMKDLLWAESQKLHRSKILWIAGFATVMVGLIVFAQGQFTFYDRRYINGAGWFMTAAQSLATFYVLPAVIALLGSYMICREEQEDTLKSLRLIPVDEVKLTLAKMILAFVFSVLIYLLLFAITFLVEAVLHLKALSVGLVLENLKIYFLDGVGVFFAISPIIALVARMKKGYWLALVFAEIYSFAGLFASMSQQLKTVYPMTAVFNISGYYNANMFQVLIGVVILMVCVILSLLILKGLNRKTK